MDLSGFPYFPVEFDKFGAQARAGGLNQLRDQVSQGTITDVFVISHGWNNDMADARSLYEGLFKEVAKAFDRQGPTGRSFAVLGVLWPSKKFADKDLIASGAASVGDPLDDGAVVEAVETLRSLFSDPAIDQKLDELRGLVPDLEDRTTARVRFAQIVADLVPSEASIKEDVDGSDRFASELKMDPQAVFDQMSAPAPLMVPTASEGGATSIDESSGGAAGIGDLFTGMKSAARNLLNMTTYYVMKERARTVGRLGLVPIIDDLAAANPNVRLHLIGHSFGARVVTSAALESQKPVQTLILLQAAFSHYGFSQNYRGKGSDGFFRQVVTRNKVLGPTLITYTRNDKAVGLAYPLASRLAGQRANFLGDANDEYGGLGSNGAQDTPEVIKADLLDSDGVYVLQSGSIHNLLSDKFVTGHSDIVLPQIANAVTQAVLH